MSKIAVIGTRGFPGVQGGVEAHCENLYTHIAEKGYSVTVFTRKSYVSPEITIYKNISLIPIDCSKKKNFEAIDHTFRGTFRARKIRPDILHIHAIGPSIFAPLARLLGMKVVVTHHGPDYKREKWHPVAKVFLRFCEWSGMTFANKIIVIAQNIADDVKIKFNRDATVIPNGVNIPVLSEKIENLKKFDLQKGKYILTVGRFVPEKGFDYLIEVFNKLNYVDYKLVIVGKADHENAYSLKLKEVASKNKNIVMTGFLNGEPLHELYCHARLFILPSYYEGLPIVLLEAMSYGLSCLASDIPANRNVELSNDRFFKPGDVEILKHKIKEFIDKPISEVEKSKLIQVLSDKYSWERIVDLTIKVYQNIEKD